MNPIPCSHCGVNFMRPTIDPEAPKLCNNCSLKEEKRNPTKGKCMDTVDILIKCPIALQIEIEEICINNGGDFTKYFLGLHEAEKVRKESEPRWAEGSSPIWVDEPTVIDEKMFSEIEKRDKTKGKKK